MITTPPPPIFILPSATPLDSLKRAREATSSLIPFPRVGRSAGLANQRLYFGQKRTGKSSLIPFPRVGKRSNGGSLIRNHFRDDAAGEAAGTAAATATRS